MLSKAGFALVILTVISAAALAEDVVVTKEAPQTIKFGDTLNVSITVANNMETAITAEVREYIGNARAISPQIALPEDTGGVLAALPPSFKWTLDIDANSQKTVTYVIKPDNVGHYLFSPTAVTAAGNVFYSNALSTLVECNLNGVCEPQYGEDYNTCRADCSRHAAPENKTAASDEAAASVDNAPTNETGIILPDKIDPATLAAAAIFVLVMFLYYAFKMAGKSKDLFG